MLMDGFVSDIISKCKIHGDLSKENCHKGGFHSNGNQRYKCKLCVTKRTNDWIKNNEAEHLLNGRNYRKINYDNKLRWSRIKCLFGIKKEEYEKILLDQNNVCAICKQPEKLISKTGRGRCEFLCVDHCHKTNNIRGLLCRKCNAALGSFNDSISMLEAAIKYLEHFI